MARKLVRYNVVGTGRNQRRVPVYKDEEAQRQRLEESAKLSGPEGARARRDIAVSKYRAYQGEGGLYEGIQPTKEEIDQANQKAREEFKQKEAQVIVNRALVPGGYVPGGPVTRSLSPPEVQKTDYARTILQKAVTPGGSIPGGPVTKLQENPPAQPTFFDTYIPGYSKVNVPLSKVVKRYTLPYEKAEYLFSLPASGGKAIPTEKPLPENWFLRQGVKLGIEARGFGRTYYESFREQPLAQAGFIGLGASESFIGSGLTKFGSGVSWVSGKFGLNPTVYKLGAYFLPKATSTISLGLSTGGGLYLSEDIGRYKESNPNLKGAYGSYFGQQASYLTSYGTGRTISQYVQPRVSSYISSIGKKSIPETAVVEKKSVFVQGRETYPKMNPAKQTEYFRENPYPLPGEIKVRVADDFVPVQQTNFAFKTYKPQAGYTATPTRFKPLTKAGAGSSEITGVYISPGANPKFLGLTSSSSSYGNIKLISTLKNPAIERIYVSEFVDVSKLSSKSIQKIVSNPAMAGKGFVTGKTEIEAVIPENTVFVRFASDYRVDLTKQMIRVPIDQYYSISSADAIKLGYFGRPKSINLGGLNAKIGTFSALSSSYTQPTLSMTSYLSLLTPNIRPSYSSGPRKDYIPSYNIPSSPSYDPGSYVPPYVPPYTPPRGPSYRPGPRNPPYVPPYSPPPETSYTPPYTPPYNPGVPYVPPSIPYFAPGLGGDDLVYRRFKVRRVRKNVPSFTNLVKGIYQSGPAQRNPTGLKSVPIPKRGFDWARQIRVSRWF